jgi:hypothetical protein
MPTALLICIKAVTGGAFVALFAVVGEVLEPKRFAGVFGASPAVALANLVVTALAESEAVARTSATGMIAGAIALAVAYTAAIPAVRRWGAVRGSAFLWGVWTAAAAGVSALLATAVGATTAGPGLARTGTLGAGAGVPPGRLTRSRPGTGPGGDSGGGDRDGRDRGGRGGGRLFGADLGAVRGIRPRDLVLRFAFGAAISVVSGLIGVAAGKFAGGVWLAGPAVLPATLTIIEKEEGRKPAVTEVQGSVPGTIALITFAVVAAVCTARLPLAAAMLCALATWVAVAIGGYLVQGMLLPSWHDDVRRLARERQEAAQALRKARDRAEESV